MQNLRRTEEDGRVKYIGADYAVTNLRNILMARPTPPEKPGSQKEVNGQAYAVSAWS